MLAAMLFLLTGCRTGSVFDGSRVSDASGFRMEYSILNREESAGLNLTEGDRLQVSLSHTEGTVDVTARNEQGLLVGVLFGLTDYAYWLYVTDLGVDRDYTRRGIGKRLIKAAHQLAGGEKDIAVYLIANESAVPFYEKCGMKRADDVMQYNHIEWTEFTVT